MKRKNPEDGKALSPVTKVILSDLKGHREARLNFNKKNQFKQIKKSEQKEETDHRQWMPKEMPPEMKRVIKETKIKRKPAPTEKKISVRKKQDRVKYTVQLKDGKTIDSKKIIIRGQNAVLITEETKTEIPANTIKWIKETRIRLLTLEQK